MHSGTSLAFLTTTCSCELQTEQASIDWTLPGWRVDVIAGWGGVRSTADF